MHTIAIQYGEFAMTISSPDAHWVAEQAEKCAVHNTVQEALANEMVRLGGELEDEGEEDAE